MQYNILTKSWTLKVWNKHMESIVGYVFMRLYLERKISLDRLHSIISL